MSDNQTQEVKIITARKKSWFSFGLCMKPHLDTVISPSATELEMSNDIVVNKSPDTHAIGRRIPKSVDTTAGFGF